jgi:putative addiction module component (TIGR02574 family)
VTSAAVILDQAMELPPEERKDLAIRILASVDDGPSRPQSKQEFEADLVSRIQEIESGNVETVDAWEVLQQARERLGGRS